MIASCEESIEGAMQGMQGKGREWKPAACLSQKKGKTWNHSANGFLPCCQIATRNKGKKQCPSCSGILVTWGSYRSRIARHKIPSTVGQIKPRAGHTGRASSYYTGFRKTGLYHSISKESQASTMSAAFTWSCFSHLSTHQLQWHRTQLLRQGMTWANS